MGMRLNDAVRVLIVDDDEFFLELTTLVLRQFGVQQIETATNGAEILLQLTRNTSEYDIILSDLNMPMMDGVELLRHLSRIKFTGGIILLTGEDQKILSAAESLAKAHDVNLLGVLQKPIQTEPLLAMLESWSGSGMQSRSKKHREFSVRELVRGISDGEIVPYYQPRISLATGEVAGVECLARWLHPTLGLIPPNDFIPTLEQHQLIGPLTYSLLEQSIAQLRDWHAGGLNLKLAINITAENLTDIRFPDRLLRLAQHHGTPLSSLVLELTENQLMEHLTLSLDTLIRLRLKGVALAIDDFGTGYSNLAQIKRAPFCELKIDRSFVQMSTQDPDGRAILEASITMGKKLGLRVVTEGVETEEELALARTLGADEVQGYIFARPMAAEQATDWLKQRAAGAARPATQRGPA